MHIFAILALSATAFAEPYTPQQGGGTTSRSIPPTAEPVPASFSSKYLENDEFDCFGATPSLPYCEGHIEAIAPLVAWRIKCSAALYNLK